MTVSRKTPTIAVIPLVLSVLCFVGAGFWASNSAWYGATYFVALAICFGFQFHMIRKLRNSEV